MNVCILMGSPRKKGNTMAVLTPFVKELNSVGVESELVWLCEKQIHACTACRVCQKDWAGFGCPIKDDAQSIFNKVLNSDVIVLATPIYSWYCTPPMKALLDRFVYGMNKYYGDEKGPALWAKKKLALVTTCGYPPDKGADLWEEGVKRYCRHSKLQYIGMLVEHDLGYKHHFMDDEKKDRAEQFAKMICDAAQEA